MYRFFGGIVVLAGIFFGLMALVGWSTGDTTMAIVVGVIAFGIIGFGGHLMDKGRQQKLEASFEEIEDGLHACLVGPQDLIVRVSPEFHENHEDIPGQKPTAESRRELKHCNVVCPEIATETDALAVRTALWNVYVPCWNCGEEADSEDSKCINCGKKLWQKPLRVHFERVTASSP
jgi:hypothetical protein